MNCYIYATTRKQNATITVELEFSWFSSSSFIETRAFKINHNNENWNVLPYSTTKMPINISPRISRVDRHVPGMALQPTWNRLASNNWTEESVRILARQ